MAVSREIYRLQRPAAPVVDGKVKQISYIVTALLALLALYVVMSHVITWGRVKYDDIRYGRPRTFHMVAPVGPSDQATTMSHFIAMNLDRQVVVFEIPGGDSSKIRTLYGPYLFGSGEDLTPVKLHMQDMNRDGVADLVMQVKDEEVIYLYRDGAFSLMNPEERQQMMQRR